MVKVQATVDINAEPETVFNLVTDVNLRADLDPNKHVIRIVKETPGPIRVGTVFYYNLVVEGHIADYRNRCTVFEPGHLIETESDTNPPFVIRVTTEPIENGTRLTHTESFSLSRLTMPVPKAHGVFGKLFKALFGDVDLISQDDEAIAKEEQETQAKLKSRLEQWLLAIKTHIESEQRVLKA